jgi:outer membrane lipoprotein
MKLILPALILLLITGCAHVFSDQTNRLVDPSVTFDRLKKEPNLYIGKFVKLGGIIASTKNTKEGSQIEIVQFRLGSDDIPDETYASGGRFLAVTPEFLDGMIYETGRPVAVVGEVKGFKTLPLDEMEYSYPVISIKEIHVWKKSDLYPYPLPYYYDPFYYPYYWYGPPYWYPYYHLRHW